MFKLVERISLTLLPFRHVLSFLGVSFALVCTWLLLFADAQNDHYLPLVALLSAWCFVLFAITSGVQVRDSLSEVPTKGLFKRIKYAILNFFWQLISLILVLLTVFTIITSVRVAKYALS
ncbi:MAG: hypothetical protein GJ680_08045 [Alteromonadaceae bacterium]|nr:hypothetical protein [Alteromonadaceae bacterium]